MIILIFTFLSALWGGLLARRRKGNRLDIAQYAAGFGIIGALIGLFLTIILSRTL
ncbi:hypothetical protein [Oceaniglobus indicus]|uniref:hypothetical protein n=1 Tax=Oceaniglobus indicus TaxID=2047749 RepID=UPI000C17A93D|nr:hypothetical protein [Oceaniglobus indicus]